MIDFWKDYNPSSNEEIPSMRGIDYERIKAYCEVIGVDMYKQPINAKFMNEMEDWYLRLAKQYSAFDKIRDEVCDIDDEVVLNPDSFYERKVYVRLGKVIDIINKYREEQTEE